MAAASDSRSGSRRMGVESRFEGGLRVTDDAALEVALGVLRGVINAELVAVLREHGADAVGWSGVDGGHAARASASPAWVAS